MIGLFTIQFDSVTSLISVLPDAFSSAYDAF